MALQIRVALFVGFNAVCQAGAQKKTDKTKNNRPLYKLKICKSSVNCALLQRGVKAIESIPGRKISARMTMLKHALQHEKVEDRFVHAGNRRIDFTDYIKNSTNPLIQVLGQ
ncbi:hypothetical protein BC940DRAFT_332236 [Gongronella butleri]|nr:hypothetical protein BC940DRAFT_332236 [Gongronella butleri]